MAWRKDMRLMLKDIELRFFDRLGKFLQAMVIGTFVPITFTYQAVAAEGGYSNYIPGTYGDFGMAMAPTETWTLRNDVYSYGADMDESVRSGNVELGADLDFLINFTTLLYKPELELFGGQYATGILVPLVDAEIEVSLDLGPIGRETRDSASGLGDIALIPFALYWTEGKYHWSFAHFIVTPTGDYDTDNDINTSLNYWSFDTNFALTYLDEQKGRDWSFNVGHIYNTENDETDYQTGQELHLDVALNQFLSESFAIGLQGFYLKQITGDSGRGAKLGDFKAEAAGIGPALLWSRDIGNQNVIFIAKWLHEFHAEKRLEGDHIYLSFVLDW
jgi:hypothetical protein